MNSLAPPRHGTGLLFEMLHHALNGKYVNFGVFELYKDPCLKRMVDASIVYISKSPYLEMRVFPKVHQALCTYLEALFSNHLDLMMYVRCLCACTRGRATKHRTVCKDVCLRACVDAESVGLFAAW